MAPRNIHFIGLLGADNDDEWMAADMSIVLTLIRAKREKQAAISAKLFAINSLQDYDGCQGGYLKFGEDANDRLDLRVPEDDVVIRNSEVLKANFLKSVRSTTQNMTNNDILLVFLVGHGERGTGDFWVGDTRLSKGELKEVVSNNGQMFLWSTACYSGHWCEDVPWHAYVAAAKSKESDSLTQLESSQYRGGANVSTSLAANAICPLPLPELTGDFLSHFRVIPRSKAATTPGSSETGNKGTNLARSAMSNITFAWPDDVDLEKLLEMASPLLNCSGPRLAHANAIAVRMQRTPQAPGRIKALWSAFHHKEKCRRQLEKWLVVKWRMERLPFWNTFSITSATQDLVDEFLDKFPEDGESYCKTLDFLAHKVDPTWPPMTWTEIRMEMALAWEVVGKPTFSFEEFMDIANNVSDAEMELKLRVLKVEKFLQSSHCLHIWPCLCDKLDQLGILTTERHYSSLSASPF